MKNPTNADIIREVREVKTITEKHDKLINEMYTWMTKQLAIDEYRSKFKGNGDTSLNKEFVSVVLKFLTVLSAILGIVYLLVKEMVG